MKNPFHFDKHIVFIQQITNKKAVSPTHAQITFWRENKVGIGPGKYS